MLHFNEPLAWLAAHSLRRRIGCNQLGMLRFKVTEPVHQRVIFRVTDFRLIQHVVQVFVTAERISQVFHFVNEFGLHAIPL